MSNNPSEPLVLYSFRRCPFAIRVRMVLEEKGIDYTVHEQDLKNRSPELLRLHPEGKVPLLVHGEWVLYESAIITEYLDEAFVGPKLMPTGPRERAEVRRWTYWCNTILKPDLDQFKYKWLEMPETDRIQLKTRVEKHLNHLRGALAKCSFLVGDAYSLADIHVFPFYRQLSRSQDDFSKTFNVLEVDAWLERITSRPSFEKVMKK